MTENGKVSILSYSNHTKGRNTMAITRTTRLERSELLKAVVNFLEDSGIPAKGSLELKLPNPSDASNGDIYLDIVEKMNKGRDTMLTNQEYIDKGCCVCPKCLGRNFEGDGVMTQDEKAFQEMHCNDCDWNWTDWYVLTHFEENA
jgi:hypothetical protein